MCFTRLFLAALPLLQPPSTAGLLWLLHFVCVRVSRLQSARWRSSCSAFPPFHPPSVVADCPALHFVCVWVSQPGSRFRGGRGVPQDNDARESWAGETPRTIRKPFLPNPCSLLIDRPWIPTTTHLSPRAPSGSTAPKSTTRRSAARGVGRRQIFTTVNSCRTGPLQPTSSA